MTVIFKIVAFLEGISYLLLLFIATPIKHFKEDPTYVKMLGMPHGLLFVLYIILAFLIKSEQKWTKKEFWRVLVASVIPFGTFVAVKKYVKG